ncbi:hypothetical protein BC830DRAFT_1088164 [Chytriomyces sp. MP71]|nr:hypothetical protein BC830DRAFT_1088164 [Chytriomyces sp. MP71]
MVVWHHLIPFPICLVTAISARLRGNCTNNTSQICRGPTRSATSDTCHSFRAIMPARVMAVVPPCRTLSRVGWVPSRKGHFCRM